MKQLATHWAGGLEVPTRGGMVSLCGARFPACCSGDRAIRINREGNQTWSPERVTCKVCLKLMAKPGAKLGDPFARMRGIER